jgi:DsbC/DsbD-like thiol-disulfide interchange protein
MTSVPATPHPTRLALVLLMALTATGLPASGQSRPPAASLRLVAGGPTDAVYAGAIEIRLPQGVKTYWRSPGEAGLPPRFDWSRSTNLKSIGIAWPVPIRFEEGGASSIGYTEDVVLPLRIEPLDPARPVGLRLVADYAVCTNQCIPVHDEVTATFSPGRAGDALAQARITLARERVPQSVRLGERTGPALVRVERLGDDALGIEATLPADTEIGDIFVEGPDGWLFNPGPPVISRDGGKQKRVWRVNVDDRPNADATLRDIAVTVTLAADGRGIEAVVPLDAAALAR